MTHALKRTETRSTIDEHYKSRFYSTLRIVRLAMKAKCEIHLLCCARLLFSEDTALLFPSRLPIKRVTLITLANVAFGQISLMEITYYFRDVRYVSLKIQTTIYFYYHFPVFESSLICLNQYAVPQTWPITRKKVTRQSHHFLTIGSIHYLSSFI
jgi:hypothetical protein